MKKITIFLLSLFVCTGLGTCEVEAWPKFLKKLAQKVFGQTCSPPEDNVLDSDITQFKRVRKPLFPSCNFEEIESFDDNTDEFLNENYDSDDELPIVDDRQTEEANDTLDLNQSWVDEYFHADTERITEIVSLVKNGTINSTDLYLFIESLVDDPNEAQKNYEFYNCLQKEAYSDCPEEQENSSDITKACYLDMLEAFLTQITNKIDFSDEDKPSKEQQIRDFLINIKRKNNL